MTLYMIEKSIREYNGQLVTQAYCDSTGLRNFANNSKFHYPNEYEVIQNAIKLGKSPLQALRLIYVVTKLKSGYVIR